MDQLNNKPSIFFTESNNWFLCWLHAKPQSYLIKVRENLLEKGLDKKHACFSLHPVKCTCLNQLPKWMKLIYLDELCFALELLLKETKLVLFGIFAFYQLSVHYDLVFLIIVLNIYADKCMLAHTFNKFTSRGRKTL